MDFLKIITMNLHYRLQGEAFIWDTKVLSFLAETRPGDSRLVLVTLGCTLF